MTDPSAPDISIVIPCYKEEKFLERNVKDILRILHEMNVRGEVILVDDGSPDQTYPVMQKLASEHPEVKPLRIPENRGRGKAFRLGLEMAQGKYAGYLDADLEIPCRHLKDAYAELENGAGLALARRQYELQWHPEFLLRHFLSRGYRRLVSLYLRIPALDTESGFKFFRRVDLMKIISQAQSDRWFFDTEITVLAYLSGMKIREFPAQYIWNREKRSTVRLLPDILDYVRALKKFKTRIQQSFRP